MGYNHCDCALWRNEKEKKTESTLPYGNWLCASPRGSKVKPTLHKAPEASDPKAQQSRLPPIVYGGGVSLKNSSNQQPPKASKRRNKTRDDQESKIGWDKKGSVDHTLKEKAPSVLVSTHESNETEAYLQSMGQLVKTQI